MLIAKDFCFSPYGELTADISNRALRSYAEGFEAARNLDGQLPIILDTNILLGFYGMSQNEKQKLIQFIENYRHRIYIPSQVEQEYLRNRLSVIKKDFFTPLNKIADDFSALRNEIGGKLQSFSESKKKILSQDYPALWDELRKIEEEVKAVLNDEKFYNELVTQVGTTTQNNKNIAYIDDLLALTSTLRKTDPLNDIETVFLKEHFNNLMVQYNGAKDNVRWKYAIPGCGEDKDDAVGDFVIFHEILKFMKTHNTSCIFLTNDVTKGDWLQKDKNPHNHYLEQSFLVTGHIVYIIHAEQTLPNISFENIHKAAKKEPVELKEQVDEAIFESTIVTIDTNKGFGFILTPDQNLYFNYADYEGNFQDLHKNDVVTFIKDVNSDGKPIARQVKRTFYSFDEQKAEIKRDKIAHINHYRGIGFITNQPENLYFHQAFMTNSEDFAALKVGDDVEFLVGRNSDGERIARLVRPAKKD